MATTRAVQVACAVIVQCVALAAQPPAAAVRSTAIVATVIDDDQRAVSGLTSGDFELRDDGQRRPVTVDASRLPLSVTVIVDRSDSLWLGPRGVRTAAARFLTDLQPRDQARVCAFNGDNVCSSGFSADHGALAEQVRHFGTSFGSRLYDVLSSTLETMQTVPGGRRRVVVVFSDGEDNGSRTLFDRLKHAALAGDVMVYGVGLETRLDDGDEMVESRPDLTLWPLARETGGGYYEPGRSRDLAAAVTRIEDELQHQYLLTFNPVSNVGSAHHIQLRATRPHLHVRTREQIFIPSE